MQEAGIDVNTFTDHSCRVASASKAKKVGNSLNDIFKTGYWSKEHTFKKIYSKDIINMDNRVMNYKNKLIS